MEHLVLNLELFLVFIGYVVISLTDKLDGYLARSRNEVTTFWQVLRSTVDKTRCCCSSLYQSGIWFLRCLSDCTRVFGIRPRMVVASKGVVIAAS